MVHVARLGSDGHVEQLEEIPQPAAADKVEEASYHLVEVDR